VDRKSFASMKRAAYDYPQQRDTGKRHHPRLRPNCRRRQELPGPPAVYGAWICGILWEALIKSAG
jgi:hypothetical protein